MTTNEDDLVVSAQHTIGTGVVWVCPKCDIAGCRHYREAVRKYQEGKRMTTPPKRLWRMFPASNTGADRNRPCYSETPLRPVDGWDAEISEYRLVEGGDQPTLAQTVLDQTAEIAQLRAALLPFATVIIGENGTSDGNIIYTYSNVRREDYWKAYMALKEARK